jgi:predicted transcriptional regulator
MTEYEQKLLELTHETGQARFRDFQKRLGLNDRTIRDVLTRLKKRGLIEVHEPKPRRPVYILTNKGLEVLFQISLKFVDENFNELVSIVPLNPLSFSKEEKVWIDKIAKVLNQFPSPRDVFESFINNLELLRRYPEFSAEQEFEIKQLVPQGFIYAKRLYNSFSFILIYLRAKTGYVVFPRWDEEHVIGIQFRDALRNLIKVNDKFQAWIEEHPDSNLKDFAEFLRTEIVNMNEEYEQFIKITDKMTLLIREAAGSQQESKHTA